MNGLPGHAHARHDPQTSTIPIIMVTSKGQETDRIWGLRQGAVDYMVKPVSPSRLVRKRSDARWLTQTNGQRA